MLQCFLRKVGASHEKVISLDIMIFNEEALDVHLRHITIMLAVSAWVLHNIKLKFLE
jgi:hypothetical protein